MAQQSKSLPGHPELMSMRCKHLFVFLGGSLRCCFWGLAGASGAVGAAGCVLSGAGVACTMTHQPAHT